MAQRIEVEILGDSSSLERALKRVGDTSSGFGSKFGKVAKGIGIAAGAAGVAVGAGFVAVLKNGFDELGEAQKVMAQTEAVIKSTGGVAKVSAKQVEGYAEELSRMSSIDDEVIQGGENMLLTFKNIRNEAGKGNDVFKQSTETLLDMSVALGTDMSKSAIQLGKALNDPVKGITALTKVGVTFTEAQKDQIKALVDAGDTMAAQKIILKELNSEFGGSAKALGETMPGQLAKLRNSFDEVSANLAEKFLPMLMGLVKWVNDHWPEIEAVIDAVGTAVVATFDAIGVAVGYLKRQWAIHRESVEKAWAAVQKAVMDVISWFKQNVVPTIRSIVNLARDIWDKFGEQIKGSLGRIVATVKTMFQNMFSSVKIILALLRGDWGKAWDELKTMVSRTLGTIVGNMRQMLSNFGAVAKALGQAILDGVFNLLKGIGGKFRDQFVNPILDAMRNAIETVKRTALRVALAIVEPFSHLPSFLGKPFRSAKNTILDALGTIKQVAGDRAKAAGYTIGNLMGVGLSEGLAAQVQKVIDDAYRLAEQVIAAIRRAGGTKSPSIYTMEIGEQLAQGLAIGWQRGMAALPAPDLSTYTAPAALSGMGGSSTSVQINADVRSQADVELLASAVARRLAFSNR